MQQMRVQRRAERQQQRMAVQPQQMASPSRQTVQTPRRATVQVDQGERAGKVKRPKGGGKPAQP
jgi:hypothetical protein